MYTIVLSWVVRAGLFPKTCLSLRDIGHDLYHSTSRVTLVLCILVAVVKLAGRGSGYREGVAGEEGK
jgi:hypothetical protein